MRKTGSFISMLQVVKFQLIEINDLLILRTDTVIFNVTAIDLNKKCYVEICILLIYQYMYNVDKVRGLNTSPTYGISH